MKWGGDGEIKLGKKKNPQNSKDQLQMTSHCRARHNGRFDFKLLRTEGRKRRDGYFVSKSLQGVVEASVGICIAPCGFQQQCCFDFPYFGAILFIKRLSN